MLSRRSWRNSGGLTLVELVVGFVMVVVLLTAGFAKSQLSVDAQSGVRQVSQNGGVAVAKPVEVDVVGKCLKSAKVTGNHAYVHLVPEIRAHNSSDCDFEPFDASPILEVVNRFEKAHPEMDVTWHLQTGTSSVYIIGIWFDCKPKVNTANSAGK